MHRRLPFAESARRSAGGALLRWSWAGGFQVAFLDELLHKRLDAATLDQTFVWWQVGGSEGGPAVCGEFLFEAGGARQLRVEQSQAFALDRLVVERDDVCPHPSVDLVPNEVDLFDTAPIVRHAEVTDGRRVGHGSYQRLAVGLDRRDEIIHAKGELDKSGIVRAAGQVEKDQVERFTRTLGHKTADILLRTCSGAFDDTVSLPAERFKVLLHPCLQRRFTVLYGLFVAFAQSEERVLRVVAIDDEEAQPFGETEIAGRDLRQRAFARAAFERPEADPDRAAGQGVHGFFFHRFKV